jgi:SanA protein
MVKTPTPRAAQAWRKKLVLVPAVPFLLVCITVVVPNAIITGTYSGYIPATLDTVPHCDIALVLGTAPTVNGPLHLYYCSRLRAAAELYKADVIHTILASGDNSRVDYDKPTHMKEDLVSLGVCEDDIVLDYAGFKTLDSMVRGKKVFCVQRRGTASQQYHCSRAVFLARSFGLDAVAYAAPEINHPVHVRNALPEYLARTRAALDVWVILRKPKFLGPQLPITSPSATSET